jgi:peptide/nickel transport system permease protein
VSTQTAAAITARATDKGEPGILRRITLRLGWMDYVALFVIVMLLLALIVPELLTPYNPLQGNTSAVLQGPTPQHWLGTDYLGRDLWSRIVYGASRTLFGSALAVAVGLGVGTVLGIIAATAGGFIDALISRVVDALLSIPGLLLAMVVVVSLGFGSLNAAVAVGVSSVAVFTRVMRSEVLTVKNLTFVEAAGHIGARPRYVLWRHIFPNSFSAVLSLASLQLGTAILWISALSFLGYGAPPPQPEWGLLVSEGRQYVVSSSWLVTFPSLAIALTVWAINRLSNTARIGKNHG